MTTVKRICEKCGDRMDWNKEMWNKGKHTCDSCLGAESVLADIAREREAYHDLETA